MSKPNEPDYIVVQAKSGTSYVTLCGIQTAGVNNTINTNDRTRRDCDNPAAIPSRVVRVLSRQWDLTGSGVLNMDQFDFYNDLLGAHADFRLLYGRYADALTAGERTGTIFGYRDGRGVMTSANESIGEEDATAEFSIAGEGLLGWEVGAPGSGA